MNYKQAVQDRIDEVRSDLIGLSDYLWHNPE